MAKALKIRYIILIIVSILMAVPVNLLQYDGYNRQVLGTEVLASVPVQVENWKGRDEKLEPWVYELLETNAIIHRSYFNGNRRVFLSIVYYADTKVGFHAPESCLGAQGLELKKSTGRVQMDGNASIAVNELTYQRQNERELVYYFYKTGNYHGNSYIVLRFNIAINKIFSGSKSGSLIRVSTPIVENGEDAARQTLAVFINKLYPFIISGL